MAGLDLYLLHLGSMATWLEMRVLANASHAGKSRYFSRIYTDNVKAMPQLLGRLLMQVPPWIVHLSSHNVSGWPTVLLIACWAGCATSHLQYIPHLCVCAVQVEGMESQPSTTLCTHCASCNKGCCWCSSS